MPEKTSYYRACRGCGKPCLFVQDNLGTWQILDLVAPVFVVEQTLEGDTVAKRTLKEGEGSAEALRNQTTVRAFVSHFVTCSERAQFSRKRNPQEDKRE